MLVAIQYDPKQVVRQGAGLVVLHMSPRFGIPWVFSVPGQTAEDYQAHDAVRGGYLTVGERGAVTITPYK
jgi:hypothetical protein